MPGWQPGEYALLISMAPLLLGSAFFSSAETALFGLNENERMQLRAGSSLTSRAVTTLLAQPRMLLITLMLGNMTVNTLYFVISSVLLMEKDAGVGAEIAMGVGTLLVLVLGGEILPKTIANTQRMKAVRLLAGPVLLVHRLIGPIRVALDRFVVAPLSRLTAPPGEAPPRLEVEELAALLDLSGREGVIDSQEQLILEDVIELSRLKVRDVMVPRVRIVAVPRTAGRAEVLSVARSTTLTRLPVYDRDLDHIAGLLNVKAYLLESRQSVDGLPPSALIPPQYVPEITTLDKLLDHFRRTKTSLAIVVDEFGGTSGIVAIEDVVEEMVGDIASIGDEESQRPRAIGPNTWRIGGDVSVHDWADAFGQRLISPRVATVGGLIIERLGRAPRVGDSVTLGNVRLQVEQVERSRVVWAIVTLLPAAAKDQLGEVSAT